MITHKAFEECRQPGGADAHEEPSGLSELQTSGRHTCSIDEAAAVLGIGRSTAYAAARDGSLPTLRLSHRLLVPTAKLLAMLGVSDKAE
jgi:excisionase family DNA binding protein